MSDVLNRPLTCDNKQSGTTQSVNSGQSLTHLSDYGGRQDDMKATQGWWLTPLEVTTSD